MRKILLSALVACAVAGCGDKAPEPVKEVVAPPPMPAPAPVAPAAASKLPDVGQVEQVAVTAKGSGMTPGAAINDALKTAITQVNGVQVEATSGSLSMFAQATASLDVQSAKGVDSAKAKATVQGQAFADEIISSSRGTVSSFKVLNMTPPADGKGPYVVDIEAKIAKFKAPADAGKIKIVVAPLRSSKQSFTIGGRQVPAQEVLSVIRQQIIDTLSQTGRFTVLDRQFGGDIENELEMIGSGQARSDDFAKLGQALSADLVWVGVVNELAYNRHVRTLQTSDRDLVSYSGAWSVSQRMINMTTRQILLSNTLQGTPPPIAPTTLGAAVDPASIQRHIQNDFVKKASEAILLRTFPISVVERTGNDVILSQGGQVMRERGRYQIYLLGKELKDPQTGLSLGNVETLCCEVVINRVTPNLSYGTLENIKTELSNVQPGALQVRDALAETPKKVVADAADVAKPAKSAGKGAPRREGGEGGGAKPKDGDW
ncbi:MAG: CsgG/HfaB family protein [Azonexus sp.]